MCSHHSYACDNDDITAVTSNTSAAPTSRLPVPTHALAVVNVILRTMNAIADSGATQILVMENTPVVNKRIISSPLKVALANGREVFSTHECNIYIVGLPTVLTGHIIPDLSIASLFGIQVLTEAGCDVHFNKHKCTVWYDNKIILEGGKDSTTDFGPSQVGLHVLHHLARPSRLPVQILHTPTVPPHKLHSSRPKQGQ
jgi:hypothetical protein